MAVIKSDVNPTKGNPRPIAKPVVPAKPAAAPAKLPSLNTGGKGKGLPSPSPLGLGIAGAGGMNRPGGGVASPAWNQSGGRGTNTGPYGAVLPPIRPGRLTPEAAAGAGQVIPPPQPPGPGMGQQLMQAILQWAAGTNTRGPNSGSEDLVPASGWDKFKELGGF